MNMVTLSVSLRREHVLHFLGYRGRRPRDRTDQELASVLEEARTVIFPRGICHTVSPVEAARLGLPAGGLPRLGLGLVTIGFELERRVSELLERGIATRALLLDAAGSAATEEAADELEAQLHPGPSRRFSPGYGAWPLTAQRLLFELLPHRDIKVELLPSCLMSPRKSISFAVWLGREGEHEDPQEAPARRCRTCGRMNCPYREEEEHEP